MLVSAAWIVPAILGAVDALAQQTIWGGQQSWRAVVFTALDWLLYGAITPFVFVLSRRMPLAQPHLARKVALHLLAALAFCAVWAGAGTLLRMVIQPNAFGGGVMRTTLSWLFTTFPFGVAVYLAVVGVEHGVRYFVEMRDREAQIARMSEQLTTARLSALQAQVNPHFLFNALNTVSVLVRDEDRSAANRVIEQLSDVLRRTLSQGREHEVRLEDELELVRQYLAVEQARFSDRLRPRYDVDESLLTAAVPSFALQHLVENAVRHGIARRTGAGQLSVSARRDGDTLELVVTDDGPGPGEHAPDAKGHGIDNTRERLRTMYADRASLIVERRDSLTVATLRVPYRELALDARRPA